MIIKYYDDWDLENRLITLFEEVEIADKQFHIIQTLEHIQSNNWSPQPPHAKPLKWVESELFEIKIKFWIDLYRIHYFLDNEKWFMIILNWYYKPDWRKQSDNYNKSKKKKLDKTIKIHIDTALQLKEKYFLNIWTYELYK